MKKVLTVLLAVLCLFSLTACGGKDNATANEEGTITIKLGGSGPISGDAKAYGLAVKNSAEIAVEEINASDSKIKFEFIFEDDEADGEKASSAYDALYDAGMQVSLFTVTSGAGAAVASKYDEDKIFAITPSGSATDLVYTATKNYAGNFQMCFTDPNQGTAAAQYMKENYADKKIGIIYKSDDPYSSGIYATFTKNAKELGLNIVCEESFTKDNETVFEAQVKKCQNAGVEVLLLPIYYQPASNVIIAAKKAEFAPIFFGVDGMDGILTLEGFDTSLAEGLFLMTPFSATLTDDKTVNFVKKYAAKTNGEIPNQFGADAYDCVYAIHQALENIGAENINVDTLYEDLIAQFTSMSFTGLTGDSMTWAENGEISKAPKAFVIKNGEYVLPE